MAENKTKPTAASVDEFIAAIQNQRRRTDALAALRIYEQITGQPPVMWGPSIIGFGTYHYAYASGHEGVVPAAAFAPRKGYLVFYVNGEFEGAEALFARLGKHKRSVACLYVNKLADVDGDVLQEIIARQYRADVPEQPSDAD